VKVAVLGLDAGNITVNNGHSLGAGATLTTIVNGSDYASGVTVTLGTNPTMVAGDTLTFAAAKVEDKVGNVAAGDVVFTVPTLIADTSAPQAINIQWLPWVPPGTGDGPYHAGEKIYIHSEDKHTAGDYVGDNVPVDAFGILVNHGHSLGSGATVTGIINDHRDYTDSMLTKDFIITLGANPTIVAGDKLAIGRLWHPGNDDGSYDAGDMIRLAFSEPVKVASLAADASDIIVNHGHSLGSGAILKADLNDENGYVSGFSIILGANPTVVADDKLTIAAAKVEDKVGHVAVGDVVFTVPELIAETIAPTARTEKSIEAGVYNYDGSYDTGDRIYILFSEPVKVASLAADASDIIVNHGHSLGSGATLTGGYYVDGYAVEFWITLGTNPTVVGADTLTIAAAKIEDEVGNVAAGDVVFAVPKLIFDVPAPTVTAETISPKVSVRVETSVENTVFFLVNSSVTVNTLADILNAGDANFNSSDNSYPLGKNWIYYLDASGLVDGTYKVYASDLGGNLSAASTNSVTIDGTAPANRGNGSLVQNDSGNSTADAGDALFFVFTEAVGYKAGIEAFFTANNSYGGSGTRASVAWSAGNTALTVILGAGESYNAGTQITFTGVHDMVGNRADVLFNFT
jgi:hypothetical protein